MNGKLRITNSTRTFKIKIIICHITVSYVEKCQFENDFCPDFVQFVSKSIATSERLCFIGEMEILKTFATVSMLIMVSISALAFNKRTVFNAATAAGIPHHQVEKLVGYLEKYQDQIPNQSYVSFVDFRKSSAKKRFILIQTETGQTQQFLVAHGKNSGELYAQEFSNTENSKKSSLGLYLVGRSYRGSNGLSLLLDGLEPSNSNAKKREIVIHYADYVSEKYLNENGRIGRSWGCFALNEKDFKTFIHDQIKDGSLLLAFTND